MFIGKRTRGQTMVIGKRTRGQTMVIMSPMLFVRDLRQVGGFLRIKHHKTNPNPVPYVASFSRLSNSDCPFGIL